jgi:ribonuclease HII
MKPSKIADIKNELNSKLNNMSFHSSQSTMESFITTYSTDTRMGVKKLVTKAEKVIDDYLNECERMKYMLTYEKRFESFTIGGIDEAGRGPLAGPVVAACVILSKDDPIAYVNDSKKLSAAKREQLYNEIIERAVSYGIGVVGEQDIDSMNILQATYKAMTIAISQCNIQPTQLLNDAVIIPGINLPQEKIIQGDGKSLSIAAASILAKVSRDRIMVAYDELFPEYGFKQHKGYGSYDHIQAIKTYGPSSIHRKTFIKNFI